jgi:hypothetical protein
MSSTLSNIMARRYSPEQLLFLRTALPVVNCVVRKLNKHPDIGKFPNWAICFLLWLRKGLQQEFSTFPTKPSQTRSDSRANPKLFWMYRIFGNNNWVEELVALLAKAIILLFPR